MTKEPADDGLQPFIRYVATGSDAGLERQLIEKSKQPTILKFTPKDSSKRFGSQAMLESWRAGGREIYWLVGEDDDLAGIIWYGKKDFPLGGTAFASLQDKPTETFAIRLYDGYTGHGLAVPAMRQTLRLHARAAEERGERPAGIWLETDDDNPAALHVYKKFGYHEVNRGAGRVTMVLPASEIPAAISRDS